MSTTFDAREGDGTTSSSPQLALADEESLHRTFLSEFAALTEEARADLGDALVLAPKVVEGAFVRAWDARARFKTPAEVHQFLVEDVHHAAARALSRRVAARRLAGSEHADAHAVVEQTPEEAWKHILHAVHGETHSPQALADAAAVSRHGAAEHISHVSDEGSPWKPVVFGGVVLAILLGAAAFMTRVSTDARYAKALGAPDARVVSTTAARIGIVTLDDGTKVRFAPDTKLIIPKQFGPDLRAVRLEGSAVFDVAPGLPKEFRVYAGDVAVVAKGTSFTVRAYPGDSAIAVVTNEGTVAVGRGKEMQDLPAGKSVIVTRGVAPRPATAAEKDEADAWRTGIFSVSNRPLGEVLPLLSRWYGLHISAQPQTLLDRRVTFRASLDSTRQAIRGIEQSAGVAFGYVGQNMVFLEPSAKAKTDAPAKSAKATKSAKAAKRR
ncbi:MAG: FecR protein [Gemmatimonadetes bacterium]|nr:FecR protein [Gemmatimonadota bacterium]